MKHLYPLVLVLALLTAGCTAPAAGGMTELDQPTCFNDEASATETTPATSAEPAPTPLEFPIYGYGLTCAIPDFLDEEQTDTYRRLVSTIPLFYGVPDSINSILPVDASDMGEIYPEVDIIDPPDFHSWAHYLPVYSKFRTMALFRQAFEQMVTPDYFDRLNGLRSLHKTYVELDGRLYYVGASAGSPPGYLPLKKPDTFELLSRTEKEIRFNVTCYYCENFWAILEVEPVYVTRTEEVVMVNTSEGWRFERLYTGHMGSIGLIR